MSPSTDENRDMFAALVDAFTTSTFDNMLALKLGKDRTRIVADADFDTMIRRVIETARREGWNRDLIRGAIEANPGNEGLQAFITKYPRYGPIKTPDTSEIPGLGPIYCHILYISRPDDTEQARCNPDSSQLANLYELTKARPLPQEAGDPPPTVSDLKDWGFYVATFGDASALLQFATNIAKTVNNPDVGRPRMGLHSVVCVSDEADGGPPTVPPEAVETARRVAELGSAGHILSTCEAGEFFKGDTNLKTTFNELFHLARNRELWPGVAMDVYNIYGTAQSGDGQSTTFGNEQPPESGVPERVISSIEVPRTLKELRDKEKIKITFWPDLPYVRVKFQFEDKKESNLKISSDLPEIEECAFEADFENHNFERKQHFNIKLLNRAKNRLVVLKLLFFDRYGKEITQELKQGHAIKLRRYFPLYWWDRFWFSRWYLKVAIAALACLIGYAGYRGYRFLTRPVAVQQGTNHKEPPVVGEADMPSVEFDEDEALLRQVWDFSGQTINRDRGVSGKPHQALVVTGPQVLLINPEILKGKVFKDFKVTFAIKLRPGSSCAGWIFRASPDKGRGYIFILERQRDGQFILHGTFAEGDAFAEGDGSPLQKDKLGWVKKVLIGECAEANWIKITATVHENIFSHKAQCKSVIVGKTDGDEQKITPNFQDDARHFTFGNVGIWAPPNNEVLVDYWRMGIYKPEDSAGSDQPEN